MASNKVVIAGVGMSRFRRPSEGMQFDQLAREAVGNALRHAGLDAQVIQQIYAGWAFGDTTSGQRAVHGMGLPAVPFFNVNNACASGSSAFYLARQAVMSGAADCALAFGFEQMPAGAIALHYSDRANVLDKHLEIADAHLGDEGEGGVALRVFAAAWREHMARTGLDAATYAQIAVKARRHAALNPNAVFRQPLTVEKVLASSMVIDPITRLQCCPPTSGAAAVLLCSESFARAHGLDDSVRVAGMGMASEDPATFDGDPIDLVGTQVSRRAAEIAYKDASIGPENLDVVELHDCFTINELLSYTALGIVDDDGLAGFVAEDQNSFGGRLVVNPSGGLLAKGHPLGATGLAQIAELTWQLRGECEARQVSGARIGLQHNVGLNGAAVVSILQKN